ncbi:unnamed protein product [Cochlearia groenlandica]
MEKRVKLRVPRLIRSSLKSCRPRDLYDDVVETTSTFNTHTTSSIELTKAKTKTTPRHRCPPTSPSFPPNPFYDQSHSFRKTKKRSQFGSDSLFMSSSRFKSTGSWCWSSSEEEEEEEETFFSSRSLTSDSSTATAVVKKSENPYEDFKKSMVEMIVERHIFGPDQLQQLLHCFISLNSRQHHNVIVHVFLDIYATLFSS